MDFISDNSKKIWLKIAARTNVPKYVNTASVLTKQAADNFMDGEFADDVHRLYPITDKANTWISAMYLKEAKDSFIHKYGHDFYDHVADRINKAAEVFDIMSDVKQGYQQLDVVNSPESENDANYGWIIKDAAGKVKARKYKITSKAGVKKAANYFDTNRYKYPFKVRNQIATFILKKAEQYNENIEELPESIIKEAWLGIPNMQLLLEDVERRSMLCKNAAFKNILVEMATSLNYASGDDIGQNLHKLAETLDGIDRCAGLNKYYGKGIMLPTDLVYATPYTKVAEELQSMVKLGSFVFDARKLAELPDDTYEFLGPEFMNSIKENGNIDSVKLAQALDKLSHIDKMLLEDQLKLL